MRSSRDRFSRRLHLTALLCLLGVLAIVGRMYELTVIRGEEMAQRVSRTSCRESVRMSYRGAIVDRNGATLATSMAASRVAARRAEYSYDPAHVPKLAPLLGVERDHLEQTLRSDPAKFIWLSRSVGVDAANEITRLGIRGIDVHRDQHRSYPQGPLAAHVIGFTGVDAQGLEGIERMFDTDIRGRSITVRVCKDVHGNVFFNESDKRGVNRGASVHLTLDATLQSIAEAELARQVAEYEAKGGSVVMLDPATGEVLAMANVPTFDPNAYGRATVASRRNRAVTDTFDPGSTAKPLVIAGALDAGALELHDRFYCEDGAMRVGGRTIHDHHQHGTLDVAEILKVSSNICSVKIGFELGAGKLHDYLEAFGVGRPTGISLPGEVSGVLRPASAWREIDHANVSFGQGFTVTALQLAQAFATLANDGVRMRPYVIDRIVAADGSVLRETRPEARDRAISAEVAREVSRMLEAVTAADGTAPQAAVAGIRVAGKTGTAQKVVDGRYSRSHWVASFVGYLPADRPRLVIAVVIDEPEKNHYGGIVAAPVFRRIAEASLDYLHIYREPVLPPAPELLIDATMPPSLLPSTAAFDGTMPDLRGLSLRTAMRALDGCDCRMLIDGHGYVAAQQPPPGAVVDGSAGVSLKLDDAVN